MKWMQNQSYNAEGLAQANLVINSTKSSVITQLVKMTATVNMMQVQLKNLSEASKIQQDQRNILLLELQDKFNSWEQSMLFR